MNTCRSLNRSGNNERQNKRSKTSLIFQTACIQSDSKTGRGVNPADQIRNNKGVNFPFYRSNYAFM